jgi:hypothetical protein
MTDEHRAWKRQGEAFWRAHHEAWKRCDLNQRQYCEVHGLPQKAFENWRQRFVELAEPARLRESSAFPNQGIELGSHHRRSFSRNSDTIGSSHTSTPGS